MYLSKLTLGSALSCPAVRRDLASPYQMHRTILRAFPDAAAGGPGRVLFHIEPDGQDRPPVVLVQSDKQPNWQALSDVPGYLRGCQSNRYFVHDLLNAWQSYQDENLDLPPLLPQYQSFFSTKR